uniref:BTB domain-containing protein n=1 Tax=Astyanax mexicanus TaxID=7994 RepID=A0A8B9RHS2_ASTMX
MSVLTPECTSKCRSPRHAEEIVAALTSGSEGQLKAFLSAYCHNAATLRDEFGRTALHLAASLGKRDLLEWLLDSKSADLLVKDKESGWTALHRSAFYGQIHCLMALVKVLSTLDKEGLSVLDITMKDRPALVVFQSSDPTEVYTWGNNANFSLGHGNQETRHHPEIVDLFARTGVYVKQVVLCKFHSVFLSQKGQVYTCGHGQGGRLGHGDEQTYLVPRLVEGLLSHHCSKIAAARDHTVVLTEEGYVYTFGLNTYHQLGLSPPPAASQVPKQVTSKSLKGRTVIGVAAGRFHTVLWTRDAVYTMGLNGGQLGYLMDPNGEKCVTVPRQVSALHHKEVTIAMVAASNGATVCLTEKGDIYLLADYQCKKLASKQLNIKKVLVSGGSLDYRVDPQILNESGGEKITILALDEAGRVFCWRSVGTSVRQCRWAYGRQVFMSDIALGKNKMMFVTQDGEGFSGQWLGEYKKIVCGHSEGGTMYERIRLEKLPYIHRAVSIVMDSKGRNFGVLQSDPKTSLYEVPTVSASSFTKHFQQLLSEADETDSIHDITLQAGDRTFPAHKYILSMRSEFFRKQLLAEAGQGDEGDGEVKRSVDAVGCDLLVLEKVSSELLEQALHFIYTDSCEMLVHGARPTIPRFSQGSEQQQQQLIHSLEEFSLGGRSALEVYRSLSPSSPGEGDKPKSKSAKSGKKGKGSGAPEPGYNPVKMLQVVAKKLGLGGLSARLDGVKYENGKINVVVKHPCSFIPYLCDVTLKSDDGKEFPCHKCVLCARLEYFNSMLGNPWIESTSCTALEMPTSAKVLQVILEYIYTDEAPTIGESVSVEFVCNVLVVADQLLITRLKEMCEVTITENLTLKNAAELLEFAVVYNAEQLKLSCLQFIVLNMAAMLESNDSLLKKAKMKAKRKPRRRSDSSGGYNLSDIIQSSPTDVFQTCSVESLHELVTSDSEGSYMGVGSPRELQSPIFQDRPDAQVIHRHNAQKFSFNLPVASDTNTAKANNPNLGATPKSPGSIKPSVTPTKLSQKQRKMMAMATREGSVEGACAKSAPVAVPVKPAKAWVTAVQSPPSSLSFRDVLIEEEQRSKPSASAAAVVAGSPTGPGGSAVSAKRVTFKCADSDNADKPAGPWVLGLVSSPPSTAAVTFASIVEEEKQQEAALIRSREKPLALIQIEEAAIQDLLVHYRAFNNPDEFIVVERAPQGPIATPMWNKHSY